MPLWAWFLDIAGAVLLLVLIYGLLLVLRRRHLSRHGGTFELAHRERVDREGRGWILGLGRYTEDSLEWFRVFSLSPRPRRRWRRADLSFDGHREPRSAEQASLYPDHVVIHCVLHRPGQNGEIELAMSAASLTGFQSWIEARRPGTDWSR